MRGCVDLLESKQLSRGLATEKRYYKPSKRIAPGNDYVDWGGEREAMNVWVTVDARWRCCGRGRIL